jgi:hypothetical protein
MSSIPRVSALYVTLLRLYTISTLCDRAIADRNLILPWFMCGGVDTVLAQNQYLDDLAFQRYLSYLMYWTSPTYAKFVVFPHALYFLRLLQHAKFREALKSPQYALILHQQQGYHWQFSATSAFRPRKPGDALPIVPAIGEEQLSVGPSPGAPDLSPSPDMQTPSQTPGQSQTPRQSMTPGRSRSGTTSPARTYS